MVRAVQHGTPYATGMVTTIRRGAKRRLFLKEWREHKGVAPEAMADRLDVTRQTIHRWEREQWRLDPPKQVAYADALDLEPEDLWRPPDRPSVDALLANAPDDLRQRAREMISILLKSAS